MFGVNNCILFQTFGYMPDDIYANIEIDRMGHPYTKDDVCKMSCVELQEDKKHNILGKVLFFHYHFHP